MTMKKFFLFLSIMLSINVFSEEHTKSESKTVDFLSENGTFIQKEYYELPKVKGIEFSVLVLTDLMSTRKMGCLRLKTKEYKTYSTQEYIGTLDADEIDACLQCLNLLKDKVITSSPSVYTETEYKTRDGVIVGSFYNTSKSQWTAYIQTKSYIQESFTSINSDNIPEIIDRLKQAKIIIAEKAK